MFSFKSMCRNVFSKQTNLQNTIIRNFAFAQSASDNEVTSKYVPRRALMYVPGDDNRKLRKACQLDVDCIALDCEDGVAISRKQIARESIRAFFDSELNVPTYKRGKPEWSVRINAVDSELCEEDLKVIVSGKRLPETLLLPKCESPADLKVFSEWLTKHTNTQSLAGRINLILYAESCQAIMNLPEICRTAVELSANGTSCNFVPVGIVFGSDDFCANIGATRTENSEEIMYARQRVVLVAKAFGLQAIDMVYIQYKNLDGLRIQSESGARMGYTGKQVIHPGQIEVVQNAFLPSPARIEWATGLLTAFNAHQKNGKGAFVYNNQMIDMPTVKQAQNILQIMRNVQ